MAAPQFNIVNNTKDGNNLNLVFYQKISRYEGDPIVAWRTISPKIGIPTYMPALNNYAVFVKYKLNLVEYQTKPVAIDQLMGTYRVSRVKDKFSLTRTSREQPQNMVQIDVLPEVAVSVEPCITLGANLVYPSKRIPPASRMVYMMIPSFYVALVPASVTMGSIMTEQDVAGSETPIIAGQAVWINGSAAEGYSLSIENP